MKLHSILIRSFLSPGAPKTLKLFSNRDDLDFSSATEMTSVQTLDIPIHTGQEYIEIPVKRALFNNIHSLTLFIKENHSNGEVNSTTLSYLGFKGDFTRLKKDPVITLYETAANPAEHKNIVPGAQYGSMGM